MIGAGKNTVTLTFAGDASKLDRTFKTVSAGAQTMGGRVGKSSAGFAALGAAAATAAVSLGRMLFTFANDSVKAYAEAQTAQTKLSDAFARFPTLADTNIQALRALNTELMNKTRFDDDALASGQAILAQYGLTGRQLANITPLLADYAAKTGKDLPGAAGTLGKAFLGNTRALKELGINYKSTGDRAKDVANITALVRDKVGGFAEKEGKTAAGQAAILSNRFGEMKEQLGQKLLPVLLKLSEAGIKVIDFISKNQEIMIPLIAVIAAVTVAQWAWNVALTANPIGLIIVGISLLIAGIVFLATKTKFFQTIWRVAWGGIKAAAMAVWDWLKNLPERIGRTFIKVAEFIGRPFRAAFNMIANAWNNTVGKLRFTIPSWVPGIGGNTIAAPTLPTFKFHRGGRVPGHPGEDVLAILQAGETVSPAGARGGQLTAGDLAGAGGAEFDRVMLAYLAKLMRRNGLVLVRANG
jgi:hypothetical protein